VFSFAVRYASNPLTKRNHFGHAGGVDFNLLFSLQKIVPIFTGTNEERQARLTKGTVYTLWELISDGRFESNDHHLFMKPVFLFGYAIKRTKRFCLTGITSCSVKLGSTASSFQTWSGCTHCHNYSPCLFLCTWTGIW